MCPVWCLCIQYVKPWPYSNIRFCCPQFVHVFTSRLDSTLLGDTMFYTNGEITLLFQGSCIAIDP